LFLYFRFLVFSGKNIGAKAALKQLVKLTPVFLHYLLQGHVNERTPQFRRRKSGTLESTTCAAKRPSNFTTTATATGCQISPTFFQGENT
jgi:hypothetical protein